MIAPTCRLPGPRCTPAGALRANLPAPLFVSVLLLAGGGCASPEGPDDGSAETAAPEESSADAAAVEAATGSPLAGTAWQLVHFQSMDDGVGTIAPEDPSEFTMRLAEDGAVSMRLGCNRANGTWTAEPSEAGDSGTFGFGPLAGTRAMCPPPNLDERILRDAEFVRGFLLRDGNLALSLMADGGVYLWEPLEVGDEVAYDATPVAEVEAAILASEPDYTRDIVGSDGIEARYVHSRIDLDGDGSDEVLVYLLGSIFCGSGGCDLLLLDEGADGWQVIQNFPISRLPVVVSDQSSNGWRDLLRPESGGGAAPSWVRHVHDGARYAESGRLPGDAAPSGTTVLAGDPTYQDGAPLAPAD